ncbi:MAG: hypothetical protein AUK30_00010 [Nitrospirae bacterium CG2_30_70_394]|nr:RNA polymerase sigma factor [Deltaproteobacteria bacterium]NCP96751.1 RNA polymerase sigma factor [Deltaproteobacteria bacterium]OIP67888.1 MAG: hypothetical protein AUK30_00010 [Nitrospirae bacterium CG2_30_70_394]PIU77939.1 MAG: hypothetical protein COS73_08720 [Nitrospirae bacterium CG06_land_8_20_14_3_00_70_43]PJB95234.1 MAG: hypothetical protein CO080_08770 [Nitrospirae bacterium CG_4_9_14_0_8_um_filter_70_14]
MATSGELTMTMDPAAERIARFRALVEEQRERAVRLAWRLTGGDRAAAEDVTQDALVAAYRALPRFRDEARLATWFYRILVRQAHSYRRWQRVREAWRAAATHAPTAPPVAVGVADPDLRQRIAAALGRLPQSQRDCFLLVHGEGFTVREVAVIVGKAEGMVKSHLHRALTRLRADLDDLRGFEERGG